MPVTNAAERKAILAEVSLSIYGSSVYNFSSASPENSDKNCEGASRALIQKAQAADVRNLQLVFTKPKNGFFVASPGGSIQAFGTTKSPVGGEVQGYAFGNHYRVYDPLTKCYYDPTFGSSSPHNPVGIASSGSEDGVDLYGVKGRDSLCIAVELAVVGDGKGGFKGTYTGKVVSSGAVAKDHIIDDSSYK